jgi:hypothetical protein
MYALWSPEAARRTAIENAARAVMPTTHASQPVSDRPTTATVGQGRRRGWVAWFKV